MQKEEIFKCDLPKINVFLNLGLQLDMKREVCTLMVRMSLKLRAGLLQMGNSGGGPPKKWRGEKGCIQAVLVLFFFNRDSVWDK